MAIAGSILTTGKNNTEYLLSLLLLYTCTRLWLMEFEQFTLVDLTEGLVQSFIQAPKFNKKHLKKAETFWLKHWKYNNISKDNSQNILNDKNYHVSSKKFWRINVLKRGKNQNQKIMLSNKKILHNCSVVMTWIFAINRVYNDKNGKIVKF